MHVATRCVRSGQSCAAFDYHVDPWLRHVVARTKAGTCDRAIDQLLHARFDALSRPLPCLYTAHRHRLDAHCPCYLLCEPTRPRKPTTRLSSPARRQYTSKARFAAVARHSASKVADMDYCRTTKKKHCDPGRRLSTTSATTTPAATPRHTAPPPRQKGPCWSPCDSWSCSVRSVWTCWRRSKRAARHPRKVCPRCLSMRMRLLRRPTMPRRPRRIQMPSIAGSEEAQCRP